MNQVVVVLALAALAVAAPCSEDNCPSTNGCTVACDCEVPATEVFSRNYTCQIGGTDGFWFASINASNGNASALIINDDGTSPQVIASAIIANRSDAIPPSTIKSVWFNTNINFTSGQFAFNLNVLGCVPSSLQYSANTLTWNVPTASGNLLNYSVSNGTILGYTTDSTFNVPFASQCLAANYIVSASLVNSVLACPSSTNLLVPAAFPTAPTNLQSTIKFYPTNISWSPTWTQSEAGPCGAINYNITTSSGSWNITPSHYTVVDGIVQLKEPISLPTTTTGAVTYTIQASTETAASLTASGSFCTSIPVLTLNGFDFVNQSTNTYNFSWKIDAASQSCAGDLTYNFVFTSGPNQQIQAVPASDIISSGDIVTLKNPITLTLPTTASITAALNTTTAAGTSNATSFMFCPHVPSAVTVTTVNPSTYTADAVTLTTTFTLPADELCTGFYFVLSVSTGSSSSSRALDPSGYDVGAGGVVTPKSALTFAVAGNPAIVYNLTVQIVASTTVFSPPGFSRFFLPCNLHSSTPTNFEVADLTETANQFSLSASWINTIQCANVSYDIGLKLTNGTIVAVAAVPPNALIIVGQNVAVSNFAISYAPFSTNYEYMTAVQASTNLGSSGFSTEFSFCGHKPNAPVSISINTSALQFNVDAVTLHGLTWVSGETACNSTVSFNVWLVTQSHTVIQGPTLNSSQYTNHGSVVIPTTPITFEGLDFNSIYTVAITAETVAGSSAVVAAETSTFYLPCTAPLNPVTFNFVSTIPTTEGFNFNATWDTPAACIGITYDVAITELNPTTTTTAPTTETTTPTTETTTPTTETTTPTTETTTPTTETTTPTTETTTPTTETTTPTTETTTPTTETTTPTTETTTPTTETTTPTTATTTILAFRREVASAETINVIISPSQVTVSNGVVTLNTPALVSTTANGLFSIQIVASNNNSKSIPSAPKYVCSTIPSQPGNLQVHNFSTVNNTLNLTATWNPSTAGCGVETDIYAATISQSGLSFPMPVPTLKDNVFSSSLTVLNATGLNLNAVMTLTVVVQNTAGSAMNSLEFNSNGNNNGDSSSGLSNTVIAGIAVGATVGVVAIALIIYKCASSSSRKDYQDIDDSNA